MHSLIKFLENLSLILAYLVLVLGNGLAFALIGVGVYAYIDTHGILVLIAGLVASLGLILALVACYEKLDSRLPRSWFG